MICGSFPRRLAWVRVQQCFGVMLQFGAVARGRGTHRTCHFARMGPPSVPPSLFPAVYVLYVLLFYRREMGLYLLLSLSAIYVSV